MTSLLTTGPTTRIAVDVTFLRQSARPAGEAPPLPPDTSLVRVPRCSVPFYRFLYDTVGGPYVWWLRRTLPQGELATLLADPSVSIHVLYREQEPAGFFELDRRVGGLVNLSYFGLLPHAIGAGLGTPLLRAALDLAWHSGASGVTVNTCTADHPRAMRTYLAQGFVAARKVREIWDIPNRLGLKIPENLKI